MDKNELEFENQNEKEVQNDMIDEMDYLNFLGRSINEFNMQSNFPNIIKKYGLYMLHDNKTSIDFFIDSHLYNSYFDELTRLYIKTNNQGRGFNHLETNEMVALDLFYKLIVYLTDWGSASILTKGTNFGLYELKCITRNNTYNSTLFSSLFDQYDQLNNVYIWKKSIPNKDVAKYKFVDSNDINNIVNGINELCKDKEIPEKLTQSLLVKARHNQSKERGQLNVR